MSGQLQLFEARDVAQPWNVRVSRRARRLSVRVYPGGRVEVVVPPGASPVTVERFVGLHRRWIDDRVADLSAAGGVVESLRPQRIDLPALGRSYSIDFHADKNEVRVTATNEHRLVISGQIEDEQRVARTLQRWLADLAQIELGRELVQTARQCGLQFKRLQVRRQRTRWGSCSASGTISLNMCVMFQETAVMRYLLIHELSHTQHMNHSRRFWALVEALEPEYRRLDRELLRGWQQVPAWVFG
jgi:predicted metal-dependent hydrolase